MGIILVIISCILAVILIPIGVIYECFTLMRFNKISDYFLNIAISIDASGNVACQGLFNDLLITSKGRKFGTIGETISSVLGVNEYYGTLTILGKGVAGILNRFQPHHCRRAINPEFHPEVPNLD